MSSITNTAKGKRRSATEKLTRVFHAVTSLGEAGTGTGDAEAFSLRVKHCRALQP